MKAAKLFKNGQSQAVRLPREFRFQGDEVFIKKIGEAVILLPKKKGWGSLREGIAMFSPDFMASRKQPRAQKRGELF
ncbi:MAG: antitoxin [Nitrospinae bacterium]|nr:antitoxin [Nitrospinota bacterium]